LCKYTLEISYEGKQEAHTLLPVLTADETQTTLLYGLTAGHVVRVLCPRKHSLLLSGSFLTANNDPDCATD